MRVGVMLVVGVLVGNSTQAAMLRRKQTGIVVSHPHCKADEIPLDLAQRALHPTGVIFRAVGPATDGAEIGSTYTRLQQLTLPAGRYAIFANAAFQNEAGQGAAIRCRISTGTRKNPTAVTVATNCDSGSQTTVPIHLTTDVTGRVEHSCQYFALGSLTSTTVRAFPYELIAIRADNTP